MCIQTAARVELDAASQVVFGELPDNGHTGYALDSGSPYRLWFATELLGGLGDLVGRSLGRCPRRSMNFWIPISVTWRSESRNCSLDGQLRALRDKCSGGKPAEHCGILRG